MRCILNFGLFRLFYARVARLTLRHNHGGQAPRAVFGGYSCSFLLVLIFQ